MCDVCGCENGELGVATRLGSGTHEHVHADGTRHSHPHDPGDAHRHPDAHVHVLEARILEKNDGLAQRNRVRLAKAGVAAINLMGAPGCGKTALLERTIRGWKRAAPILVIEGDQATANDGERIRAAGAAVVQVNTGAGCHLDADMVALSLDELHAPRGSVVVIENVGNLVCPALFDLGERRRVAVLSVAEGDDKPLKYPHMFRSADLVILSKIDLAAHVDFDLERAAANARLLNPDVEILRLSARTGEGLEGWHLWLEREATASSP